MPPIACCYGSHPATPGNAVVKVEREDRVPQWTKRVVTKLSGRDPLGLSPVGELLADRLLPGIVTNTSRARYYALYCWMLWHIEQEEKPENAAEFVAAFQRREAAVALATMLVDDEASPVGKVAVKRHLRTAREQGEVNVAFRVLPANPLGGFGQYYRGCLYRLGLTYRTEDGIERVAPGAGEELARAVQRTLSETPYLKRRLYFETSLDLRALERSSERLTIDAISQPFAAEERRLLIDLFFASSETQPEESTLMRRQTLTRILALVDAYEGASISVHEDSLSTQLLYGPTYFGVLGSEDGAREYGCPPLLAHCSDLWRQFCLHQFVTQALEGLLDAVLRVLSAHPYGADLGEILDELIAERFGNYIQKAVGVRCHSPAELLTHLGVPSTPGEVDSLRMRVAYGWIESPNEWICDDEAAAAAEVAARSCVLLAVLYAKWRGIVNDTAYAFIAEQARNELAAPTVLPALDSWLGSSTTWAAALRELTSLIVGQHNSVMYSKGRLESCWLHPEDNRLVRDQDYEPYLRSSRHEQSVSILTDLGLLRWTKVRAGQRLRITSAGGDLKRRLLLDAR